LLVASIIGGALFPAIMGFISDHSTIRVAFIVPLICQAYVLYFAMRGYRPVPGAGPRVPELSTAK
jgi:FHS family L-fucose permease-like MFS transporter